MATTIKEKIASLKDLAKQLLSFSEENGAGDPPASTEGEYKLADGTIVKAASLNAGTAVTLVTADGEVPAPEGDYSLEDGRILKVDAAGNIVEVMDAPTEQPPAEEASIEMAAIVEQVMEKVRAEFSAILTAKDEQIAAIEKANTALINKNKETTLAFSQLVELVDELGKVTPAPITDQKGAEKTEKDLLGYFRKTNS